MVSVITSSLHRLEILSRVAVGEARSGLRWPCTLGSLSITWASCGAHRVVRASQATRLSDRLPEGAASPTAKTGACMPRRFRSRSTVFKLSALSLAVLGRCRYSSSQTVTRASCSLTRRSLIRGGRRVPAPQVMPRARPVPFRTTSSRLRRRVSRRAAPGRQRLPPRAHYEHPPRAPSRASVRVSLFLPSVVVK